MAWSWSDIGGGLSSAGKWLGDTAYSITPADNVMNIIREFQKPGGPNWGTIGKNVLGGAADVAMFALPAARAGKIAYYAGAPLTGVAGRAIGSGLVSPLAFEGAAQLGGKLLGSRSSSVGATQRFTPSNAYRPRTVTGLAESATAGFKSAGANKPYYQSGPYGSSPVSTYTDSDGRVMTWNPTSKIYEVTGWKGAQQTAGTTNTGVAGAAGAVGAAVPTALPAIDPRMQAQIDAARRQGVSATEREKSNIATEGTQLSLASSGETRGARRRARGGFLDLASSLAEMGYTGSPAMLGVGQEALARQEAGQLSNIARELAAGRADLGQRSVAADQRLRQLLNDLAAQELAGRAYASFQGLQNYGGR